MADNRRIDAADAESIGNTIGRIDAARVLFKPRVDAETVTLIAGAVINGLKIEPASINVISDMAQLPPERVKSWATQCWVNVVGELAATDAEMEKRLGEGHGYVPTNPAVIQLYKRKLAEKFHCFLWIVGWRGAFGDVQNCFTIRLLVLDGVIRIEDLQAKLDGQPGGWGVLDSTVNGVRHIALATKQRIKTVATNERIEQAFRRRGFVDPPDAANFVHTEKARPLELPLNQLSIKSAAG